VEHRDRAFPDDDRQHEHRDRRDPVARSPGRPPANRWS